MLNYIESNFMQAVIHDGFLGCSEPYSIHFRFITTGISLLLQFTTVLNTWNTGFWIIITTYSHLGRSRILCIGLPAIFRLFADVLPPAKWQTLFLVAFHQISVYGR